MVKYFFYNKSLVIFVIFSFFTVRLGLHATYVNRNNNGRRLVEVENSIVDKQKIIVPVKLKKGDTVGLIAPANFSNNISREMVKYFQDQGINVVYGKSFYEKWHNFGGTDEIRASDINEMFADKNIDAIFAVRGGYGTIRIVDKIDYDIIKENPKIFAGFSDITTLLIAINEKTGLVTYHAPMSTNLRNIPEITKNSLEATIFHNDSSTDLLNLLSFDSTYEIYKNGIGEGLITGGNLSLIVASLGTPYEIDTRGKILFIEEVGEPTYKIDRMFQQLRLAGKFDEITGLILGDFDNAKKSAEEDMYFEEVVENNFKNMNIPIIKEFKSGHVRPFITVPIGAKAKMDTYKREIIILEED